MQDIKSIQGLILRSNIEVFPFHNKKIILYDDHRSVLNVLFESKKLGLFSKTPNLLFFDKHDDACDPRIKVEDLFREWGANRIEDVNSRDFWSFVEFDLSGTDDDWLLAGMELDLINDAVVIGQTENSNMSDMNNHFDSSDGTRHELFDIPHIDYSIGCRGCLGDSILKEPYYETIRNIFEYNQLLPRNYEQFSNEVNNPFVLDFDLDCFTTECEGKAYAWPEVIFWEKYCKNEKTFHFMRQLIDRSSFITICREPKCCGGIGESNKILGYLDNYFFNGCLGTFPIK